MTSIIIPTYCPVPEVAQKLERCLTSIIENSRTDYELVIVEQGPSYALELVAGDFRDDCYPPFTYTWEKEPMGFAAAVNRGVQLSRGDYLFIVNNDIVVGPDWDTNLLDVYCAAPMYARGLISPVDHDRYAGTLPHLVTESWWSCALISRATWDAVGPLDSNLLNYRFHDQDWSIRCVRRGYGVMRYTGVRVQHDESSTYRHMAAAVDESSERAEMVRRYGHAHFFEWVAAGRK